MMLTITYRLAYFFNMFSLASIHIYLDKISKYICMLAKLNMLCLTIKCSHTLVTIQLIHNMHAPI